MDNYFTPSYVLFYRKCLNNNIFLILLTLKYGLIHAIIKEKCIPKYFIQPFLLLQCIFIKRNEIYSIYKCELENNNNIYDINGQMIGLYINELILSFFYQNEPDEKIFYIYQNVIAKLANDKFINVYIVRDFEISILNLLGFGIPLEYDDNFCKIQLNKSYYMYPDQLPILINCKNLFKQYVFSGEILNNIRNAIWNKDTLIKAKCLSRLWITYYLNDEKFFMKVKNIIKKLKI
jgi:DNA repair protein RecO